MQEKVKGFFQKIKQWWLSAAKKTKILLGAGAAAVLVVIALVLAVSLNQPYTVLFTGLNQTDLTAIVSYLSDNGVTDYQIPGGGHGPGSGKSGGAAEGGTSDRGLSKLRVGLFHVSGPREQSDHRIRAQSVGTV